MSGRGRVPVINDRTSESMSADGGDDSESQSPIESVFNILRNSRRRAVLDHLRSGDGTSTLKELAEQIAADENNIDVDQLSSQQRKRVYISLYQNHLEKMADAGLIEYDPDRGTVELREYSTVAPYLASDDQDDPWHRYVAAFAVLVATVSSFWIVLTSSVCAMVLASISIPVFLGTAVIELRRRRGRS